MLPLLLKVVLYIIFNFPFLDLNYIGCTNISFHFFQHRLHIVKKGRLYIRLQGVYPCPYATNLPQSLMPFLVCYLQRASRSCYLFPFSYHHSHPFSVQQAEQMPTCTIVSFKAFGSSTSISA